MVVGIFQYTMLEAEQEYFCQEDHQSDFFAFEKENVLEQINHHSIKASHNDVEAQFELAKLYKILSTEYWMQQDFENAQESEEQSKHYYSCAAAQGHEEAKFELLLLTDEDPLWDEEEDWPEGDTLDL